MNKRYAMKALSLFLVMSIACSCVILNSAAVAPEESLETVTNDMAETTVDMTEEAVEQNGARSTWQLFTMEAARVTNMLVSSASGKSFRQSDLVHGGLLIQGSFEYALSGRTYKVRCGVCIYDEGTGTFRAVQEEEGHAIFALYRASEFTRYSTYYGFIQNTVNSEADYVIGRLTFYDTNEAG